MTTAEASGMKKYLAVYVALLVITAIQFAIGYQNIEGSRFGRAFSDLCRHRHHPGGRYSS